VPKTKQDKTELSVSVDTRIYTSDWHILRCLQIANLTQRST